MTLAAAVESYLAIFAAFAPSVDVVSPLLPVPILAVALLVMSRRAEPFAVPAGTVTAIRRNRQRPVFTAPRCLAAAFALGLFLLATGVLDALRA